MFYEKKITRVLIFTTLLFLITSCAGINIKPPGPDVKSILILPFTEDNTTDFPYSFYYQYNIVNKDDTSITYEAKFKNIGGGTFLVVDSLPPGNYGISSISTLYAGRGIRISKLRSNPSSDRFKLVADKITIFQNSINITKVNNPKDPQQSITNYRIARVSSDQKDKILETLKKQEHFDKWGLRP